MNLRRMAPVIVEAAEAASRRLGWSAELPAAEGGWSVPLTDVSGKAKALYEARRSRQAIEPFTDADPGLGMADGYAIAQQLTSMLIADGDTVIGYKVGLTSKPMQQMIGVGSPDHGPVLGSTVYASGDTICLRDFLQPRIEAEIAFVLGRPARARRHRAAGPPRDCRDGRLGRDRRLTVRRLADQAGRHRADLASNGAVAVSSRIVSLDGLDPRLIGMVLTRSGELVDTGAGAAALGDPVAVVAWLANTLGEMGAGLEAGQLIMTGALHAAVPMRGGRRVPG